MGVTVDVCPGTKFSRADANPSIRFGVVLAWVELFMVGVVVI
jgi:hypothetical protein